MKRNHDKVLKQYYEACDKLASEFVSTYFPCEPEGEEPEAEWVAETIGGVLVVGDYFFNMDTMVQALEACCSEEALFRWYDEITEHSPNLENYLKLNP